VMEQAKAFKRPLSPSPVHNQEGRNVNSPLTSTPNTFGGYLRAFALATLQGRGALNSPLTPTPLPLQGRGALESQCDFWRWIQVLFWVVLVVFSLVQSKIVHYSSMCYLPLTYGATLYVEKLATGQAKLPSWVRFGWVFIGCILGLACLVFPFLGQFKTQVSPLLAADPFAVANLDALADMHWSGWEPLVGVWSILVPLVALYLFKKQKQTQSMQVLFGGTALTVMFVLWAFMGRIEYLTQGSAISFLESLKDKKAYIVPIGYRTYTVFFYPQIKQDQAPSLAYQEKLALIPDRWRDSLLTEPTDRPVYAISKINEGDTAKYPLLRKLGSKNGFVFWVKR